jgi:D-apionolactonase
MSRAKTLFGTSEPAVEETILTAGPLSAIFSGGALRSVSVQGVEVIRGLYFLIRDRNWATVVPELRDLEIEQSADRFSVRFAAHCLTPADRQSLVWNGAITGSAADGLRFEAEATPESDLLTRRTGFVILHPLERVVGARVTIEHVDGRTEETRFPDLIDPLQCFFDIRAMTHEPIPGIRATCRMDGGGWETEDHRNWLDASFKTYFRALALPHPYTLPAGEQVRQSVALTFTPSIDTLPARAEATETTISVGDRTGWTMPRIGLSATPGDLDEGIARAGLLHEIGAQELSLRLRSDDTDLPGILRRAARLADALDVDVALELAVSTRSDTASELDVVRVAADAAGFSPTSVFVTPEVDLGAYPPSVERPPSPPLADLYEAAREAFPESLLGGGMFHFFTELNRRRPPVELLDFVQHSSAANVHAADDRSVMETLESLPHVFRSVRAIAGGAAYRVGPAHIGMAVNPYGDSTTPNPDNLRRTMVTDDPRHGAQFGAAYATGYLARAAIAGLDTVIMGAVGGPFGVIAGDRPTPMFHVIAGFARLAGAATLQAASSNPRQVLAMAAEGPLGREVWVANLTPAQQRIRLDGIAPSELSVIDENSSGVAEARPTPGSDALLLEPYAVARVTW